MGPTAPPAGPSVGTSTMIHFGLHHCTLRCLAECLLDGALQNLTQNTNTALLWSVQSYFYWDRSHVLRSMSSCLGLHFCSRWVKSGSSQGRGEAGGRDDPNPRYTGLSGNTRVLDDGPPMFPSRSPASPLRRGGRGSGRGEDTWSVPISRSSARTVSFTRCLPHPLPLRPYLGSPVPPLPRQRGFLVHRPSFPPTRPRTPTSQTS